MYSRSESWGWTQGNNVENIKIDCFPILAHDLTQTK